MEFPIHLKGSSFSSWLLFNSESVSTRSRLIGELCFLLHLSEVQSKYDDEGCKTVKVKPLPLRSYVIRTQRRPKYLFGQSFSKGSSRRWLFTTWMMIWFSNTCLLHRYFGLVRLKRDASFKCLMWREWHSSGEPFWSSTKRIFNVFLIWKILTLKQLLPICRGWR